MSVLLKEVRAVQFTRQGEAKALDLDYFEPTPIWEERYDLRRRRRDAAGRRSGASGCRRVAVSGSPPARRGRTLRAGPRSRAPSRPPLRCHRCHDRPRSRGRDATLTAAAAPARERSARALGRRRAKRGGARRERLDGDGQRCAYACADVTAGRRPPQLRVLPMRLLLIQARTCPREHCAARGRHVPSSSGV